MVGIEQEIREDNARWAALGRFSVLHHFILRNGEVMQPRPLDPTVPCGAPKQCFANASRLADARSDLVYVEGLARATGLPLLVHHAWCVDQEGHVVDNTWEHPALCRYMGVRFEALELAEWQLRLGFYGLLDTGVGLNTELMFSKDLELAELAGSAFGGRMVTTVK